MNYDSSDPWARRVFSMLLRTVGIFKKDHAGGGRAASVKMTLSGNRSSKTTAPRHLRYSKADRWGCRAHRRHRNGSLGWGAGFSTVAAQVWHHRAGHKLLGEVADWFVNLNLREATRRRIGTSLGRNSLRFQARDQTLRHTTTTYGRRSADSSELRTWTTSEQRGAFSAFRTRNCHPASSSLLLKRRQAHLMSKCGNARLRPESKQVHIIWVPGQAEAPRQIIPAARPSCDYTSTCRMSVTGVTAALMMSRVSACWQGAGGGWNSPSRCRFCLRAKQICGSFYSQLLMSEALNHRLREADLLSQK